METVRILETSVITYQPIWHNIPEDTALRRYDICSQHIRYQITEHLPAPFYEQCLRNTRMLNIASEKSSLFSSRNKLPMFFTITLSSLCLRAHSLRSLKLLIFLLLLQLKVFDIFLHNVTWRSMSASHR